MEYSVMECEIEISVDDCWEATMCLSPGMVLGRFTCNTEGSLVTWHPRSIVWGEEPVVISSPHSNPLGILLLCQTEEAHGPPKWLRCPQELLLCAPSTMMLRCPVLEKGMCQESSHNCTKAWGQSSLVLIRQILPPCPVRGEGLDGDGPILPLTRISFPPLPPESALGGDRPCQTWASWGLPMPLLGKWQIYPTGLSS